MRKKIESALFSYTDGFGLELFRKLFVMILIYQSYSFYKANYLEAGILAPRFLFCFQPFTFLNGTPEGLIKVLFALFMFAPIGMFFQKIFRISTLIYLISFSFFVLVEQSYFNNHFYLIILLCGIWLFYKPYGNGFNSQIQGWLPILFQFMIVLVYFYGGLAKLNADWLIRQEPVRTMLALNAQSTLIKGAHQSELVIAYYTYGGAIFDLVIGFLLIYRRTLWLGVALNVLFHLNNAFVFNIGEGGDIGIFPAFMIASNVLFIPPEILKNWLRKIGIAATEKQVAKQAVTDMPAIPTRRIKWALIIFITLQVLLPFRYLLVGKDVDWTGQQQFFSWRMKVHSKKVDAQFFYKASEIDSLRPYPLGRIINTMQIRQMGQHANMVWQFVQFMKSDLRKKEGLTDPIIEANIRVAFNGRDFQNFVRPGTNLAKAEFSAWKRPDWIEPPHQ
jgi:vitamin K-dependent gamma-carboxylase